MKSTRTLYLARELRNRDRLLITLLSELLADRLQIQVVTGADPDTDEALERTLHAHRPAPGETALLWVSCLSLASRIPLARELGYRIVIDHPGHPAPPPFRLRDLAGLLRQARWGTRGRADERGICEDAEAVLVRSSQEAARLTRLVPDAEVHVLPSPIDSSRLAPLREQPGEAILLSGDYRDPAQLGGLRWFVGECLPFLRARYGARPGSALPPILVAHEAAAPADLGFLAGTPEITVRNGDGDPRLFERALADALLFVIPAREESRAHWRTHAHDQTRILQAMAAGRGVLSTGVGASGLILSPTYDVWIADAPDRFAAALAQLMENPELRRQLTANAIQTVDQRYDLSHSVARIREILSGLKSGRPD